MGTFLNFDFLAIFNLFVLLLWMAADSPYAASRRNVIGLIVLIMAVLAVVADVVFIVLKFVH